MPHPCRRPLHEVLACLIMGLLNYVLACLQHADRDGWARCERPQVSAQILEWSEADDGASLAAGFSAAFAG